MAKTLREELQDELHELHKEVQAERAEAQDRPKSEIQNEIEQRTNLFEIEWTERLAREERAELRVAREDVPAVLQERDSLASQRQDAIDAQRLPKMESLEDQVAYSNSRMNGVTNSYHDQERAREAVPISEAVSERINNRFAALRDDLTNGLQQIETERQPTLTAQTSQQLDKEEKQATLDKFDELVKANQRNNSLDHDDRTL